MTPDEDDVAALVQVSPRHIHSTTTSSAHKRLEQDLQIEVLQRQLHLIDLQTQKEESEIVKLELEKKKLHLEIQKLEKEMSPGIDLHTENSGDFGWGAT